MFFFLRWGSIFQASISMELSDVYDSNLSLIELKIEGSYGISAHWEGLWSLAWFLSTLLELCKYSETNSETLNLSRILKGVTNFSSS